MSTSAMPTILRHAAGLLLLLLLARMATAGDVHVVDAGGGGNHTTIQAAVDAAASGDIVLIQSGTYAGFAVTGKGLSVIADGAPVLVEGGVLVRDTLVHQPVLLSGLEVQGAKVVELETPALVLLDTAGAVRVEDCEFRGAMGNNTDCGFFSCTGIQGRGVTAVTLERALDVAFVRCEITGGQGQSNLINSENGGGHGVFAVGSMVAFQECVLRGGDGGTIVQPWSFADGGDGGHGVLAQDAPAHLAVVHFAGTSTTGGKGGDGADCIDPSGDGGHGALLVRTGPGTRGMRLDSTFTGGAAGCFAPPLGGNPGEPLVLDGALMTTLQGVARQASLASPIRELQPMQFSFTGVPGDLVFLFRGVRPGFTGQPALGGVLYLLPQTFSPPVFVGTLPGSGSLEVTLTAPALASGVEGQTLFLQAMFRDQASMNWLAAPATPVLLDAAF